MLIGFLSDEHFKIVDRCLPDRAKTAKKHRESTRFEKNDFFHKNQFSKATLFPNTLSSYLNNIQHSRFMEQSLPLKLQRNRH